MFPGGSLKPGEEAPVLVRFGRSLTASRKVLGAPNERGSRAGQAGAAGG